MDASPGRRNFENVAFDFQGPEHAGQRMSVDGRWIVSNQGERAVILLTIKDRRDD